MKSRLGAYGFLMLGRGRGVPDRRKLNFFSGVEGEELLRALRFAYLPVYLGGPVGFLVIKALTLGGFRLCLSLLRILV